MRGKYTREELAILLGWRSTRHGYIMPFVIMDEIERFEYHEAGALWFLINEYVRTGEYPVVPDDFDPVTKDRIERALQMFVRQYDKDASKYLEVHRVRSKAGAAGARARYGKEPSHDPDTGEVL